MRRWNLSVAVSLATLLWTSHVAADPWVGCLDDGECASGETCLDGECLATCASDLDCAEGFACLFLDDAAPSADPAPFAPCPEDEPECEESKPEPPPADGGSGVCIAAPPSCSSDADCAPDEICKGGASQSSGSAGSSDSSDGGAPPFMDEDKDDEGDQDATEDTGFCVPIGESGWDSECEEDSDCPAGMVCDAIAMSSSASDMPECICDNGREGCDCATEGSSSGSGSEVIMGCVQKACESDADCGGELVCITETWEICAPQLSGAAPCDTDDPECGAEDEGFAPEEPECETQSESYCAPKYMAPCELDTDCGEGFTCIEEELCACDSNDVEDVALEPDFRGEEEGAPKEEPEEMNREEEDSDCSCEFTGEMICELDELPCSSDADCTIDGWVCEQSKAPNTCAVDEASGEEVCEEESSVGQCFPGDWNSGGSMGVDLGVESALSASDDAESSEPSGANASASGEAGAGSASGGEGSSADPEADASSEDEGGCQGAPRSQGGFLLLLLCALAALRARRLTPAR